MRKKSDNGNNMTKIGLVVCIFHVLLTELVFTKGTGNETVSLCDSGITSVCDQDFKNESLLTSSDSYQNCSVLMRELQCWEDRLSQCQLEEQYRTIISHKTSVARRRVELVCPAFRTLSDSPEDKGSSGKDSNKSCQSSEVDECLQSVYPFMKNESLSGLSADKEERSLACSVFTKGMVCIDDYASRCLELKQRKAFQRNLWGARQVMVVLCNNENIGEGNDDHNECFRVLSSKISNCLDALQKSRLKRPYYSKQDVIRETCCGQKNFLHCVSYEAHRVCDQSATDFVIRILKKMYTPQVNRRCKSVTVDECSGCPPFLKHISRTLIIVLFGISVWSSFWSDE